MAILIFNEVSQLVQEGLCLGHWNNVLHTHCLRGWGGKKEATLQFSQIYTVYLHTHTYSLLHPRISENQQVRNRILHTKKCINMETVSKRTF